MAWNDRLDPESDAYRITTSPHARIRVLAGPGAGKSFAMKRRVARLLEVDRVPADQILAVTFTRVAAEDLHRELVSLEVPGAAGLRGRTVHSLAMSLLMQNHVFGVLGRHPTPLNEFELDVLLSDLGPRYGTRHERRRLIRAYGAAWARLQNEEPGYVRTPEEREFAEHLVDWLTVHEAMLMDEVVPQLLRYLRQNPGAEEFQKYSHILIDEFQDLNRAEQEVLGLLARDASICVIGDDDQSIYSFRYAHPTGIRDWIQIAPTDEHSIQDCRRCPTTIVRMANALISHNRNRIEKVLVERPENGAGEVAIRQYASSDEEAAAVAEKITSLVRAGTPPGEIIVLAQRRPFATPIFRRLRQNDVPVRSYYAEAALDTPQAQERFAILKLFINSEHRVALRWLLGYGHGDWMSGPYGRVLAHVRETGLSPSTILTALTEGRLNLPRTQQLVARFQEITAELDALHGVLDLDEFIERWLPHDPATELLREAVESCRDRTDSIQGLYEALQDAFTQPEIPLEVAEVRIMSLHKSKGLSSPYVFVVGCVEGLIPMRLGAEVSTAERFEKLEEDRRLMYVGITRVKANPPERLGYLALTYPQTMLLADARRSQIHPAQVRHGTAVLHPSSFLAEMEPHIPRAQFNLPL